MRRGPLEIKIDILNALSFRSMSQREIAAIANVHRKVMMDSLGFLIERSLIESIEPPILGYTKGLKFFYQITDLGREIKNNITFLQPLLITEVPERWSTRRE